MAVKCAVYRPTGLVRVASKLIEGDLVKVGAGVRKASKNHEQVLNVEFFEVLGLAKYIVMMNPFCTRCKKRMKSKGKDQGYKCTKCGKTASKRIGEEIPRQISKQLYLPIPSAHRHLTRPAQRMGKMNTRIEFNGSKKWFCNLN